MEKINIEYSFITEGDDKIINVRVLDEMWKNIKISYLFGEIAESLLLGSIKNICFDMSSLTYINSSNLGVLMNIANLAIEKNKKLKFKVNKYVMEIIKLSGMDTFTDVEEVTEDKA